MNALSRQPGPAHAVARHPEPERFTVYAEPELSAAPIAEPGICFNPACSATYTPSREWQMFCCTACERACTAELRKWGHKMALALLVWRMGKYEQKDEAIRARTRAARRFITMVQTAWLEDRASRAAGVK